MPADLVPVAPVADDWALIERQAQTLAKSNIVPSAYRGKPNDILVAILWGNDLGLGPIPSLKFIDVIEGEPALSTEGRVALVRKAGHSIKGEMSATKAWAHGKRADNGDELKVEWTIEMAQRVKYDKERRKSLTEKDTWQNYPEAMLWARAVSQLCRALFPDVTLGLSYSPEEVRDFIEENTPPPCTADAADADDDGDGVEDAEVVPDGPPAAPDRTGLITKLGERNRALSQERRASIQAWLASQGVEPGRPLKEYDTDVLERALAEMDRRDREGWPQDPPVRAAEA